MDLEINLRYIKGNKAGTLFVNENIRVKKLYSLVRRSCVKKLQSFKLIYNTNVLEPYGRLRQYIEDNNGNNNIELVITFLSEYYLFGIVTKKYYFTVFDSVENNTIFERSYKHMRHFYAKLIDRSIIFYRYFVNTDSYILCEVDVITGCIKFSSDHIKRYRMNFLPIPQIEAMEMSGDYIFYMFYNFSYICKFNKKTQKVNIIGLGINGENTICAINNYLIFCSRDDDNGYFINVYAINSRKIINKFQVYSQLVIIERINNTNSVSILNILDNTNRETNRYKYKYIIYDTETHQQIQTNNTSIDNLNDIIFGFICNTYVIIGLDLSRSLILIYNLDHELILTINNPSQSSNYDGNYDDQCLVKVLNNKLIIKPYDSNSDMHIIKIDIDNLNTQIVGKIKYNLDKDNIMLAN